MNPTVRHPAKLKPLSTLVLALCAVAVTPTAFAAKERSGKEVVTQVCATCHESGKDGAPKISDRAEWAKRAAHGLDVIAANAITGVRKMPAHGGQASLTDLEMTRAVAYMVSGGHTPDPKKAIASPRQKTGAQLVHERCMDCHIDGKGGAPKIGHIEDWTPRLQQGVDALYSSAISGNNAMQARAGMANLSDSDIRAAVEFMVVQQKPLTR